MKTTTCINLGITLAGVLAFLSGSANAQTHNWLNLLVVNPGPANTFTGTLGGSLVNGSVSFSQSDPEFLQFNPTGPLYFESTIDGTSPQWRYDNVYTPSSPQEDRVGYTMSGNLNGSARVLMTFSPPIVNPQFHVANLDSAQFDFSPTGQLTNLFFLNGNNRAGDGDGFVVGGTSRILRDANPGTLVDQETHEHPFMAGPRSAYGSVQLAGTFNSISFNVARNPLLQDGGDGGSFTLSVVPEPSSVGLLAVGLLSLVGRRRRPRSASTPATAKALSSLVVSSSLVILGAASVPSVCKAQGANNPIPGIDVIVKQKPGGRVISEGVVSRADIFVNGPLGRSCEDTPIAGDLVGEYDVIGTGFLEIETAGIYTFFTNTSGSARLRLDGADVIVDDFPLQAVADSALVAISLSAGEHELEWSWSETGNRAASGELWGAAGDFSAPKGEGNFGPQFALVGSDGLKVHHQIPEPSAAVLATSGLVGMLALRRRRA